MRRHGGIFGKNATPTQSSASGIWTTYEVEAYARSSSWPALPGAPTSVTGTVATVNINLSWTAPASTGGYSISDYTIQYSSDSGSTWGIFSHSASSSTSITVTGLTSGTAYIFRVAAVTVLGTGAYSSASSSLTPTAFTPTALLLTSGTSYTVPTGASSMKAWAVGQGGNAGSSYTRTSGAGGTAYKTWSCSGGQTVSYSVGATSGGASTTVTFGGTTITGFGGGYAGSNNYSGGTFSGGDGGANGGSGGLYIYKSGAVGGNTTVSCSNRNAMTDISGLKAAVGLAGGKTTEDCGDTAAFGSGGGWTKGQSDTTWRAAGYGGGTGVNPRGASGVPPSGAVVLYFT